MVDLPISIIRLAFATEEMASEILTKMSTHTGSEIRSSAFSDLILSHFDPSMALQTASD